MGLGIAYGLGLIYSVRADGIRDSYEVRANLWSKG